jgi:OOP family OmpA-OmpF porin
LRGLNFASGSEALPPGADDLLQVLLRELQEDPGRRIEIRGFTDDRGGAAANLALSERRARAVRDYLIANGIAPERLRARGFGEANPVAANDSTEGRARNRRIEVWELPR